MLAANPSVSIPPESHFLGYLYFRYAGKLKKWNPDLTRKLAKDIAADAHFLQWGLDPEDTVRAVLDRKPETFAATIEEVFLAYAAREGKTRWGDKTPNYVHIHRELRRLFPDLRLIDMIRDGRDVACSHLSLAREHGEKWVAGSAPAAAAWWRESILKGRQAKAELGHQYIQVKYEDLVSSPEEILREICVFADLEYDERMLRYEEMVRIPSESPFGSAFERVQQGLQKKARDWRAELTPEEIGAFEAVAGAELEEFGYPSSDVKPGRVRRREARLRGELFLRSRNGRIGLLRLGHRYAAPLARWRARRRRRGRQVKGRIRANGAFRNPLG
jgi:hypothetical protein